MRDRAVRIFTLLVLTLALGLAGAACGGGDEGAGTGETDTGALFPIDTGGVFEPPPPPPETTEPPAEVLQITVPKPGEAIGPQSPAARIAELQRALVALGFKIGEPDGIYGGKTRKAVSKFQKNHKLEADGLVGPKTAKAINKELKARAAGGNAQ
jgi:peptidoglycan hydrolase-like protein with peptidoglycan-binding domain